MGKLVAIAGIGDEAPIQLSGRTMLAWGVVLGTAVGVFVATLAIRPPKRKRS